MKTKNHAIGRVKAGPDDGLAEGEFIVYPSTFTREPDSYGDVVAKGAFEKSIKAWKDSGNTLPGLFGHRLDDPDYYVASAIDMGEDDHGWWVKGVFDLESPKGRQVYRLVKGRRLTQLSFAFDTVDSAPVELKGGVKANELRELKVYEFSFVPVGANQDTSVVAVKAMAEALIDDAKAGKTLSAKTREAVQTAYDALGALLADNEETAGKSPGDAKILEKANNGGASHNGAASRSASAAPNGEKEDPLVDFFKTIESLKGE